jgi:hypothetical protein
MLFSLTVVVVSRKNILVFDTSGVNLINGWILVKRICSTVETTKQRLGDLRHHLKKRGYNDKVIESGFSKASEISTVEHIRFTLMAWLNGILLKQCLGW